MANPFASAFLPSLTGDLAQAGPSLIEGRMKGQQFAQEMALKQIQALAAQQQLQQGQASFPLQQHLAQQQIQKEKADIEYKRSLGKESQARAGMYSGTGMYPPPSVEEAMRRRLLTDPNDPQALQYFAAMSSVAGLKGGGVTPLDDTTLQTMAFRGRMDPTYKPEFKGPYAGLDKQKYEQFAAGSPMAPAQALTQAGKITPEKRAENITEQRVDFTTRRNTETAFATGQQGRAVKSMNVALHHLNTLEQLGKALPQNNLQDINRVFNFFGARAGADAVTNFNTAKKIVADEISKAIIGGATALGDREETVANIMAFNSPQQLLGAIKTYKELMTGQLKGLQQEYEGGTKGKGDFNRYVSKEVREMMKGGTAAPSQEKTVDFNSLR